MIQLHHETFADFIADPTVLMALVVILLLSVVMPLAGVYFWRWWRLIVAAEKEQVVEEDVPVPGGFNPDIINRLWKPDRKKKADDKAALLGPLNNDDDVDEDDDDDGKENGIHEDFGEDDFKISREDIRFVDKDEGIEEDAKEGEKSTTRGGVLQSKKTKKSNTDEEKELLDKITKDGLHGKLATAQLRSRTSKLEKNMTDQEREEERRIRNEQLERIFKLMADQENKFGIHEKGELVEQMRLYSV